MMFFDVDLIHAKFHCPLSLYEYFSEAHASNLSDKLAQIPPEHAYISTTRAVF